MRFVTSLISQSIPAATMNGETTVLGCPVERSSTAAAEIAQPAVLRPRLSRYNSAFISSKPFGEL